MNREGTDLWHPPPWAQMALSRWGALLYQEEVLEDFFICQYNLIMLTEEDRLLDQFFWSQRPKTEGEFLYKLLELCKIINDAPNKYRLVDRDPEVRTYLESLRRGGRRKKLDTQ